MNEAITDNSPISRIDLERAGGVIEVLLMQASEAAVAAMHADAWAVADMDCIGACLFAEGLVQQFAEQSPPPPCDLCGQQREIAWISIGYVPGARRLDAYFDSLVCHACGWRGEEALRRVLEPCLREALGGGVRQITYAADRVARLCRITWPRLKEYPPPLGPVVPGAFLASLSEQDWQELAENDWVLDEFQLLTLWQMTGRDEETAPSIATLLFADDRRLEGPAPWC